MRKNNNLLYDAIINNVAKEVKRAINETWEDVMDFRDSNMDLNQIEYIAKLLAHACYNDNISPNFSKIPDKIVSMCKNNPDVINVLYKTILKYINYEIGNIDSLLKSDLLEIKVNQNSYLDLDDEKFNRYMRDIDSKFSFTYNGKYICLFDPDNKEELNLTKKLAKKFDEFRKNGQDILKVALCTFESSLIARMFSKLFLWMVRLCLESNCEELINTKFFNLTNILTKEYKANPRLIVKVTNMGSLLKNGLLANLWFKKAETNYQMAVSTSPVVLAMSIIPSARRIFLGKR